MFVFGKELETEIIKLNKVINGKEQKLREVSELIASQNKMILELKTENSDLRYQLSEIKSVELGDQLEKTQLPIWVQDFWMSFPYVIYGVSSFIVF